MSVPRLANRSNFCVSGVKCGVMSSIQIPPPPGAPSNEGNPNLLPRLAQGQFTVQIPGLHGQTFSHDQLVLMAEQWVLKS